MIDYEPMLFMPKHLGKYYLNIFVPLPNANETLVFESSAPVNGVKIITYNVAIDTPQQTLNDLRIINERNAGDDHDVDDCHSVEVVVNHPDGSGGTTTRTATKAYADHNTKK